MKNSKYQKLREELNALPCHVMPWKTIGIHRQRSSDSEFSMFFLFFLWWTSVSFRVLFTPSYAMKSLCFAPNRRHYLQCNAQHRHFIVSLLLWLTDRPTEWTNERTKDRKKCHFESAFAYNPNLVLPFLVKRSTCTFYSFSQISSSQARETNGKKCDGIWAKWQDTRWPNTKCTAFCQLMQFRINR